MAIQGYAETTNRLLKTTTAALAVVLAVLTTFHLILLLNQVHLDEICNQGLNQGHRVKQHQILHCGKSVPEAKAKGCWWDELTKAWLPAKCPRGGSKEYGWEGMLWNTYDNATSWAYWWDQAGTSTVNLDDFAVDEDRDPDTLFGTTSREHLAHCAWSLNYTIYAYENGFEPYDLASGMDYSEHCVDTLFRKATRGIIMWMKLPRREGFCLGVVRSTNTYKCELCAVGPSVL